MKKKLFVLSIMFLTICNVYSQSSIIKKCTDNEGNTTYLNVDDVNSIKFKCKKTNLGDVVKINTLQPKNNPSTLNVSTNQSVDIKVDNKTDNKINADFANALVIKKQQNEKKIENFKKIIVEKNSIIKKLTEKLNITTNPDMTTSLNNEISYHKKGLSDMESEMDIAIKENAMQIDIKLIEKVDGPKSPINLPVNLPNN